MTYVVMGLQLIRISILRMVRNVQFQSEEALNGGVRWLTFLWMVGVNRVKREILHIDDDRLILTLLGDRLTSWGYTVCSTTSPVDGVQLAKLRAFPIILIDSEMSEQDGLATLKEIRKCSPKSIVIMVTGSESESFIDLALESGASDILFKPVRDFGLFKERVDAAFEQAENLALSV